ncbi:DNA alkylation repair protein [Cohnella thailandensis]|uniref:DNA alkylation repair protein n=1 Tax=Cohnella thailandensis TaxID=557557 RepID=A0A841T4T9_9BACL|nr:DNA alkylation repair protein [Cohnella thailandensis]MBB6637348.1 DNA alkylation repair protein [Cohnella thailandensis]MBP1976677.1 3-methyladenine DNA glycosylase AlkC [Cohnella thailandensis]
MAEPLKAIYNATFIREFGAKVRRGWSDFDSERFAELTFADGWDELELKGRMRRISLSLGATLPQDYPRALAILEAISPECRGFPYLIFPDFVQVYGLGHWERSITALERFTPLSSAEFAIRPFILKEPERTMEQMLRWAEHPDEHVRRLASEGCRPRLPWADALPAFKKDPAPILPILELLKADPSEYVRRSVANNLNDISKDHPDLVLDIARRWSGKNLATDAMLKHACRTLIRANADPEALSLFGLNAPSGIVVERWEPSVRRVPAGGSMEVAYEVRVPVGDGAKLRLELAVSYPRKGGRSYRKLFKLSEKSVEGGGSLAGKRKVDFRDLSTRKHEPGIHGLALIVNGHELASAEVELVEGGREA